MDIVIRQMPCFLPLQFYTNHLILLVTTSSCTPHFVRSRKCHRKSQDSHTSRFHILLGIQLGTTKHTNLHSARIRIFWAKLRPDLNSGSENTSKNTPPMFFPRRFWPAKFLGSLKNVVYPFGGLRRCYEGRHHQNDLVLSRESFVTTSSYPFAVKNRFFDIGL